MKSFFLKIFTWWNGATIGTYFYTWRHGTRVGSDENGNIYYQGGKDSEGRTRRWVIYNGYAEASSIPPGWHGWMHHRTDISPADDDYLPFEWQKPHISNLTGSTQAYRPKGSILNKGGDRGVNQGQRPTVTGDYNAWSPRN